MPSREADTADTADATTLQYQAIKKGGPFELATIPKLSPEPNEVAIRPKAIGLNPLDVKKLDDGFMVPNWPAVFGLDGAGTVEAVGAGVTRFKEGDEVFSLFGHEARASSFQEVAVVPEHFVAEKPASISFEEAASLPINYCTAAAAIYYGLRIPLPNVPESEVDCNRPASILVVGGRSGVGGCALQLLRLSLPLATILTTSAPQHREALLSLGASDVLDRYSPTLADDIKAVTPGNKGVDMILDAVSGCATRPEILDSLDKDGMKQVSEVVSGRQVTVPEEVKKTVVIGRKLFEMPGGKDGMVALAKLLEKGEFKVPLRVKVVGKGFEAIAPGLEELRGGVHGTKLVVTV